MMVIVKVAVAFRMRFIVHNTEAAEEQRNVINKDSANNTATTGTMEESYNHLESKYVEVIRAFHFLACDSNFRSYRDHYQRDEKNTSGSTNQSFYQRNNQRS